MTDSADDTGRSDLLDYGTDSPLRGELLSADRLMDRARRLAQSHSADIGEKRRVSPLQKVLDRASSDLQRINSRLAVGAREGRSVSPAIEWLLDNYYLIEEQVRAARDDLPAGYGAQLPWLKTGPLAGYPRIWDLALTLVAHTDSRIEEDYLDRFVAAYQEVSPLTIGEVWAVPIVLRLALVENLRRLSMHVSAAHDAEREADLWADRLLTAADDAPGTVPGLLKELSSAYPAPSPSMIIRLSQRVADQESDISAINAWVERAAERAGKSLDALTQSEHQRQAADQVSIANAITSIRFVDSSDWRDYFERTSVVEAVLRADPAGVYASMDFDSRDRYRHALEQLAKRSPDDEVAVARACVSTAAKALRADATDQVKGHVGYYLISGGRYGFEESLRYRPMSRERVHRSWLSYRSVWYWGMLLMFTLAFAILVGGYAAANGARMWALLLLMWVSLIPLSELATNVVNRLAAGVWLPRQLPKLDSSEPVSGSHRTLVVVAALFTSPGSVRHVIDNLEVHYLSNRDENIHFSVLADLKGADAENTPADSAVIATAQAGIDELNSRYGGEKHRPFHLFVRARQYNEVERTWMGWERKRGAIVELNRLLRGATDTSIALTRGDGDFLPGVTFVIVLDTDTLLPRDSARKLISTIAHPLNRAQVDHDRRIVSRGYGLVQPRVGMTLASASKTPFAAMHTGPTGIDPYSGAVSNTYQDVFGEGSFTGKGIYEVDVFNTVLEGRLPPNRLLSHDLLEGCYLRVALASDIEVLDDYPATYTAQCSRLHRWVRGDWQLLPWLGATVPDEEGRRQPNPLTPLHKWKITDNLRRSLFPTSMVLLATAGWLLVPKASWEWAAWLVLLLLFETLMHALFSLAKYPRGIGVAAALRPVLRDVLSDVARSVVTLATLPHQAWLQLDGIIRALWRSRVSHRGLLEWTTAAEAELAAESSPAAYARSMGPAVLASSTLFVPAMVADPVSWPYVLPIVLLWLASPALAWHLSNPFRLLVEEPSADDIRFMRRVARKTWRFFETFVTHDDHWLAPDNFQEDPKGEVAHRTSPTNMGLQLIAGLSAHDLGYVSLGGLTERTERALETMAGLDRYRGHFYNWYDTLTLQPLRPEYVSTVDSGNLAGHLLALRAGLLRAAADPLIGVHALDGIGDGLRLALEDLLEAREHLSPQENLDELRRDLDALLRRVSLTEAPISLGGWVSLLTDLARSAEPLPARADALEADTVGLAAVRSVHDAVDAISRHLGDIEGLAPWAGLLADAPFEAHESELAELLEPVTGSVPSLVDMAEGLDSVLYALDSLATDRSSYGDDWADASEWARAVADGVRVARTACGELLARIRLLCAMSTEMWQHTDFGMLYDPGRELFSIGFNTEQGRLDNSYYDMLASECRLASYLAVARGQVPQEHWFRLGRQITRTPAGWSLLSWSASMFEYLMPLLVMRSYPDTLLDGTYRCVVRRQIQYGAERKVPWGVSESAFNAKDAELTYQYQAFGVPGLGLKRGLSEDVVVAPYATMLALMIDRPAALANLRRLYDEGAEGRYGYYEAIDYTPGRVPAAQRRAVVKAYMAHHQGMGFVAIAGELTGHRMRERFHSDPLVETAELLLQERVPRHIRPAQPHVEEVEFVRSLRELPPPVTRSYPLADTPTPATHFLSNGRYSVMVTNAGGGYSRWMDTAVSRYREDITRDCWGQFCFIRDASSGKTWSNTFQPSLTPYDDYHCILSADRAEFRRRDGDIEAYTEVVVSPEDDVEVRRIALTNHGHGTVELEVTSYFEVSLAPQSGDQAHRAFSNLFVETEAVDDLQTLLFTRRPRSSAEERVWGFHTLSCETGEECEWSYETDRARFVGRLHQVWDARAARDGGPLSGTVGPVLDPVCAIRHTVVIPAGDTVRVAFCTGVADKRYDALLLAEKYRDIRSAQRAIDLAWSTSQIELRDLGLTPDEAVVFQRLASRLLLTDPYSRLKAKTKVENTLPMSALWSLGISGDHPILLVKIERIEDARLVRQALLAHQYWRHKGFTCDLVVLNTKASAYHSELDDRLNLLVRTGHALQMVDKPGGVFIRRADQIEPEIRNLLESVARVVLEADRGPIVLQLNQRGVRPEPPDPLVPKEEPGPWEVPRLERPELTFDNGYGGFDLDRNEYVITLDGGRCTPAPWVNVMASPDFGTMVTEAGISCTWALNSHENRLTTWNNDPVSDGSGELVYVRDEDTGAFWSPTPLPIQEDTGYVIRHGRGYSVFEHRSHGIAHEMTCYVPAQDPVRVVRLRMTNESGAPRRLSATQFIEWVLGDSRSRANQRVVTNYDTEARMLTAHSWFNEDFPGRIAFLACDRDLDSYTASRSEFLGRNGRPADPAAMSRKGLGGLTGRFHDNCGALMTIVELDDGETADVRFLLGQCDTLEEARALVAAYRDAEHADAALAKVHTHWDGVLDAVTVSTPDAALDAMVNGPALYQALACRVWGRTAMYQSSGAYGFRDQLQDVMALTIARPDIARRHIVEASRHQFEAGDVLHWWQPASGRGVRTRFTDDRAWLPFVVADYIETTGDLSVLDEQTAFVSGPEVAEGHEDLYLVPVPTLRTASVHEHCVAALEASRETGEHGLPLMGGGDWNDGMNRVGIEGRGESVWLAWFLILTLKRFAAVCERKGEAPRADEYRRRALALAEAAEKNAWDGAWYRRAYFDDGTPLGTKSADECRIDAIAQAWATISGAAEPGRALRALESVEEKLVSWEDGLVKLLTPPFDQMPADPGYIKGYVPGVRENGGQYTHAAIWVVMAYALVGDGDEAVALLDLINPVNHTLTSEACATYRVEPYVLAADVYAASPHVGRGGWTWYTGAASWFYNVAVRTILGIRTEADESGRYLAVDPCIPKAWPAYSATVRLGDTTWEISVENPRGVNRGLDRVTLDGEPRPDLRVPFADDGKPHRLVVTMLGG